MKLLLVLLSDYNYDHHYRYHYGETPSTSCLSCTDRSLTKVERSSGLLVRSVTLVDRGTRERLGPTRASTAPSLLLLLPSNEDQTGDEGAVLGSSGPKYPSLSSFHITDKVDRVQRVFSHLLPTEGSDRVVTYKLSLTSEL